MAYIRRTNAKKALDSDAPMPNVYLETTNEVSGLRFDLTIGHYRVSLSEMERDIIVHTWGKLQKLHEGGK